MNLNIKKILLAGTTMLLLGLIVIGANLRLQNRKPAVSTNFIMDTVIEQKLYGKNREQAVAEINRRLQEYEKLCSMYVPESEISRLNANAGKTWTQLSPQTLNLVKRAKEFGERSQGLLDITIAPLTKLWGITEEHPKVPPKTEILAAKELVDYRDILIDEDKVMLRREGQSIDLGAAAKGAACDIVREVAQEYEITAGYVSIGGNLIVLGEEPGGAEWRFGVRDPAGDASEYIGTLTLTGKTMATTGTYERWFEEDGKRYHHVLDPRTGYPAESDLTSVSVISEDGLLADCLSTAFFVAGREEALAHMNETEYQLIIADIDGNVTYSPGLAENFQPNKEKTAVYHFEASKGEVG